MNQVITKECSVRTSQVYPSRQEAKYEADTFLSPQL